MPEEKILSASRIKTLETCSWKYWCNYVLKLPKSSNAGAARGTVCHLVLELLLDKRRSDYIKIITDSKTIESVPSISRLVKKNLTKLGYYDPENHIMCDEMILVALNCDFLGKKGAEINSPEKEFLLESEDPRYKIMGYIDKPVEYPKEIVMVDYKTSKQKFSEEECEYNVQALAYLLAAKQIWPKIKKTSIEFQFLKFPEQPIIEIRASEEQLKGFEEYLSYIYEIINNYSEEDARSNFAAYQERPTKSQGFKGPLNCGFAKFQGQLKKDGSPMWHCEHKFAFEYYALLNEDGEILQSSMKEEDLDSSKGVIEKRHYEGCPAHNQSLGQSNKGDGFGF
jgi:hypothetical protein|tara:strand:- start:13216 stop:14232 length:1017 start_codon:yes stop_codon:yes gene_type:complete